MSNSTQHPEEQSQKGSNEAYEVKRYSQGQYVIQIPEIHVANSDVSVGDSVKIKPINYNGGLCLAIGKQLDSKIERTLRESQSTKPVVVLTLPKRLAQAAQLEHKTIRYNSDGSQIIGLLDHQSRVTGALNVFNITTERMQRWKNGSYAYNIPDETSDKIELGDSVWFWYDVIGDGFVFALEVTEENAPEGAIEITVYDPEDESDRLFVHLPKQVCDAFSLSGSMMDWGHDGERILGLLEPKSGV